MTPLVGAGDRRERLSVPNIAIRILVKRVRALPTAEPIDGSEIASSTLVHPDQRACRTPGQPIHPRYGRCQRPAVNARSVGGGHASVCSSRTPVAALVRETRRRGCRNAERRAASLPRSRAKPARTPAQFPALHGRPANTYIVTSTGNIPTDVTRVTPRRNAMASHAADLHRRNTDHFLAIPGMPMPCIIM